MNTREKTQKRLSQRGEKNCNSSALLNNNSTLFTWSSRTQIKLALYRKGNYIKGYLEINAHSYQLSEAIKTSFVNKLSETIKKYIADCKDIDRNEPVHYSRNINIKDRNLSLKQFHKLKVEHEFSVYPLGFSGINAQIDETLALLEAVKLQPSRCLMM